MAFGLRLAGESAGIEAARLVDEMRVDQADTLASPDHCTKTEHDSAKNGLLEAHKLGSINA